VKFKTLHIRKCSNSISSSVCFTRYGGYRIKVRWKS